MIAHAATAAVAALALAIPACTTLPGLPPAEAPQGDPYRLVRVVDGDTIRVNRGDGDVTVRIIGADTPETKHPRKPVECFGLEATAATERILGAGPVYLVTDATQDTRDRYGRMIAYVHAADGTDLAHALIAGGYAHEYTYRDPYQRQRAYQAAETLAEREQRGLWADDACNDNEQVQAGNAVAVNVAQWIGRQVADVLGGAA